MLRIEPVRSANATSLLSCPPCSGSDFLLSQPRSRGPKTRSDHKALFISYPFVAFVLQAKSYVAILEQMTVGETGFRPNVVWPNVGEFTKRSLVLIEAEPAKVIEIVGKRERKRERGREGESACSCSLGERDRKRKREREIVFEWGSERSSKFCWNTIVITFKIWIRFRLFMKI